MEAVATSRAPGSCRLISGLGPTCSLDTIEACVALVVSGVHGCLSHQRTIVASGASCAASRVVQAAACVVCSTWAWLRLSGSLRAEVTRGASRWGRDAWPITVGSSWAETATVRIHSVRVRAERARWAWNGREGPRRAVVTGRTHGRHIGRICGRL